MDYQALLLILLVLWPMAIIGLLYLMSRLEDFVKSEKASSPEKAGLEPVGGRPEREVRIVFGDKVVGETPRPTRDQSSAAR
jgi:hypothetical protein